MKLVLNTGFARLLALLALAVSTSTQAGLVQGAVQGVPAGTTLDILRDDQVVTKVVVMPGQRFSVYLDPGRYTVRCPTATRAIFALKGPVVQNIICPDSSSNAHS